MGAPAPRDPEPDEMPDMIGVGWHVTVCLDCGARIEHTTAEPRSVRIVEQVHGLGHDPAEA